MSPVRSSDGHIVGASKIARDNTERRRAQEQQQLLVREMGHRVKNLFAITSGMVALSARSAATPREMAAAVQSRLAALTRAHQLTRPGLIDDDSPPRTETALQTLMQTILSPYVDPARDTDRIVVEGADVSIGGHAITSLALILHELATNAAKYGALSSHDGRLRVDCSIDSGVLRIDWTERGGPHLDGPPQMKGFGGVLTREVVTGQFKGELSYDWKPEGLSVRLSVPVDRLSG